MALFLAVLPALVVCTVWMIRDYISERASFDRDSASTEREGKTAPIEKATASPAPKKRVTPGVKRADIKRALLTARTARQRLYALRGEDSESPAPGQSGEELRRLREALPGNQLLPEKTPKERRYELKKEQDARDLMVLIRNGEATERDLEHMYTLTADRYRDEIEAIEFCEENLREAAAGDDPPLDFCMNINASNAAVRRKVNEDALASLKRAYEHGFSIVREKMDGL